MENILSNIDVLHIDQDMIVINKPAGLLSIQDGYNADLPHVRSLLEQNFGRLYIIHRLDKDTSGVMILARNRETHKILNTEFDERKTSKEYLALVIGQPDWEEITIDSPLTVDGDRAHRTRVLANKGKPAKTLVQVLDRWEKISQVAVFPKTGYTHQIRAHLSSIGFPILFDTLYLLPEQGADAKKLEAELVVVPENKRLMLHAINITIVHPGSNIMVTYSAPMANDMADIIAKLKKKGSHKKLP
jgi:RluA family pseudouridine synthase